MGLITEGRIELNLEEDEMKNFLELIHFLGRSPGIEARAKLYDKLETAVRMLGYNPLDPAYRVGWD